MIHRKVPEEIREVFHAYDVVTFLFAAYDGEHNNAAALKEFIESKE